MTVVDKRRRKNCKIENMDLKKMYCTSFGELVGKLWADVKKRLLIKSYQ